MAAQSRQNGAGPTGKTICRCEAWWVKAIKQTIKRSDHDAFEIADAMGISEAVLSDYQTQPEDRNGHHRCLHGSRLVPLTEAAEDFSLINAVLGKLGLESPQAQEPHAGSLESLLLALLSQIGHLLSQAAEDLDDHKLDLHELADLDPVLDIIRRKIDQLQTAGRSVQNGKRHHPEGRS